MTDEMITDSPMGFVGPIEVTVEGFDADGKRMRVYVASGTPVLPPSVMYEGDEVTVSAFVVANAVEGGEKVNVEIMEAWYVALCQVCGLPMPFRSEQERDDWADQHGKQIDLLDKVPHKVTKVVEYL